VLALLQVLVAVPPGSHPGVRFLRAIPGSRFALGHGTSRDQPGGKHQS